VELPTPASVLPVVEAVVRKAQEPMRSAQADPELVVPENNLQSHAQMSSMAQEDQRRVAPHTVELLLVQLPTPLMV
jgi:hypothetical protein